MNTGIIENEMGRTKYIVDKVSGKFDIDHRYENDEEKGYLPKYREIQQEIIALL
jgi:hypothetical protein